MFAQLKGRGTVICLLLMAGAPMVEAQEVANSFDQLRVLLKRGDTVSVTDSAGHEITGRIADVSPSLLGVRVGDSRRDLVESEVTTIRQPRHGNLAHGAEWGFGIGAAFGAIAILANSSNCSGCSALIPLTATVFGGIGCGIGVGISASMISQQVIFSRPITASTRVAVTPFVTRERQAMLVSLRF
jgi:hypothetical protein